MSDIDLIRSLHGVWNTGELALIDGVYAPDFVAHWPAMCDELARLQQLGIGVDHLRKALKL